MAALANSAWKRAAQRLAVLIGRRPGALDAELVTTSAAQPAAPTALAVGDASDLLRRRPDVRADEWRLAAKTARTGLASADVLASLTLFVRVPMVRG